MRSNALTHSQFEQFEEVLWDNSPLYLPPPPKIKELGIILRKKKKKT
jgi:hypothetical protein